MSKKHNYSGYRQQPPSAQFVPPSAIAPYVGQWVSTTIPRMGPVVAYIISYNPANGMVDLWLYRPGSSRREFMQYHYSDLIGIGPYLGPIPPYQGTPTPPTPYPPHQPQPYPPYHHPYPPHQSWPSHPPVRRSCSNYKNKSQQLACHMGLIPPI